MYNYQELFNHMNIEHDLLLTQDQMHEIVLIVEKILSR